MGFDASKEIARGRLQAEMDAEQRGEQRTVEAIAEWLEESARRSEPHPHADLLTLVALRIRTREWKREDAGLRIDGDLIREAVTAHAHSRERRDEPKSAYARALLLVDQAIHHAGLTHDGDARPAYACGVLVGKIAQLLDQVDAVESST